jgi:hypothetical protein
VHRYHALVMIELLFPKKDNEIAASCGQSGLFNVAPDLVQIQ